MTNLLELEINMLLKAEAQNRTEKCESVVDVPDFSLLTQFYNF